MQSIDNILKRVKENKALDYSAYIFYNPVMKNDRMLYEQYCAKVEEESKANLTNSANEYIERSNEFFGISVISLCVQEARKLTNAQRESINKATKTLFAQSLEVLSDTMEKSGITDLLLDRHNLLCSSNGLDVLQVTKEQVIEEFDVEKNARDKLIMLYSKNAFWLNKYVKMLISMETQSFYAEGIDPKVAKGLKTDELQYLLYMAAAKYDILKRIYKEKIYADDERKATSLCRKYEKIYSTVFEEIFPDAKNDIFDDYDKVEECETLKDSLYDRKNVFTNILLRTQMIESAIGSLNPGIKQWGVRRESDDENIIFLLEPQGYMLPISFHLPKYIYEDAITSFGLKKYNFPEFEALKRLDDESKIFSTNVLVRPTQTQIKQIKILSKQNVKQKSFLKRVLEQIEGKPHSHTETKKIEIEIGD